MTITLARDEALQTHSGLGSRIITNASAVGTWLAAPDKSKCPERGLAISSLPQAAVNQERLIKPSTEERPLRPPARIVVRPWHLDCDQAEQQAHNPLRCLNDPHRPDTAAHAVTAVRPVRQAA
eukprot:CAMPEP_0181251570 /NCGR_PEP_ID=MMETSP1096-20121128/46961_1 /TAXON_ID=156174 ORGANISM="Chrysochromulina ericina, Strain CCMP281" /NCGR_SAMPLE_ID=MMETSP1096 /ASSEMBLY_ACC=CAM_ASM_000453 /LENGTH=122 /DNA_ID=CAMNT_0023349189 /DNA_START=1098 /DNA_END=1462 /DNA_ORIENTATION=+